MLSAKRVAKCLSRYKHKMLAIITSPITHTRTPDLGNIRTLAKQHSYTWQSRGSKTNVPKGNRLEWSALLACQAPCGTELPSVCYNLISTSLERSSLFIIELRSNISKYCYWMLIGVSFDLQKYLGIIDFFLNISSSYVLSLILTLKSQYIF